MPGDRRQPGGGVCRIPPAPPGFSGLHESVLDHVLGFLAVLQNAISDGEQTPARRADSPLKSVAIALDGGAVNCVFGSVHFYRSTSLDARTAVSARKIFVRFDPGRP